MNQYDKDVALNAVLYVVKHNGGSLDMHALFKTLYFTDMEHLSKYGRSVTGDTYIAMQFGPMPSMTYDIFKAVRGDSFFSYASEEFKKYFHFVNKFVLAADKDYDPNQLSESDIECLNHAIKKCEGLSFGELTNMSHGLAWQNTQRGKEISIKDMLRETGDTEEYAEYVANKITLESSFC